MRRRTAETTATRRSHGFSTGGMKSLATATEAVLSAAGKQMERFRAPSIPRRPGGSMANKGV